MTVHYPAPWRLTLLEEGWRGLSALLINRLTDEVDLHRDRGATISLRWHPHAL